ncbi:hypothetical protein FQN49_004937 [Arthroderma sp. PD_2]|nr:hypothetical protein FQN49_004937 [Arthroderma sp. PD_2]
MKEMRHYGLLLALMGSPTAIGSPWQYYDGRIVVRDIVSEFFGSAPAPTPAPYVTNTSQTAPLAPSSWVSDLGSCNCPITYVPMLPVECKGDLFYATKPPELVYTTITEVHTVKPIGSAPPGPPTLITPPPPCSTFSCPPSRCKIGIFPSLAPLISTISVTKKTTILGVPSAEPPPSFKETDSESPVGQNSPPESSPTDGSNVPQPTGDSQSEGDSQGGSQGGSRPTDDSHPDGGSDSDGDSHSDGGSQPPDTSMVDPGPITSGPDSPSNPTPTRTMFNLGGVPITVQETGSIAVGNGPSRTTITGNTKPTTFAVDGHTFTVNPSEVIYLDTTFRLGGDPTMSPPLISGSSNPTEGNDGDEGIHTDSEGNTISPRPTGSTGGSSSDQSPAVRTTAKIDTTFILGIITTVIFGGFVGLL